MEAALIGLIGALVGAYVSARFASKEQRSKEISALAEFLQSISQSLMGMHKELSKNQVPTYDGNRLKSTLKRYKATIAASKVGKQKRKELEGILPDLESLLTSAEFEDEVLRGAIIRYDATSKEKLLLELQRTAACLEGMVAVLKVVS